MDQYLHDGLQICTPDLLGFGHSTGVNFAGISCCRKKKKNILKALKDPGKLYDF